MDNSQTERTSIEPVSDNAFHATPRDLNTKPKKPPQPVKEPVSHRTSFFDLPREIRDMVYDYYWLANPGLKASSTPFHRLILELHYHGQYEMLIKENGGYERPENIGEPYPTWLLASKQLLTEALHQFASNAAWFWSDWPVQEKPDHFHPSSILDTSQISSMILCVKNFDHGSASAGHRKELQSFALAMSTNQTHGAVIRCLRFVSCSHLLARDRDFGEHAMYMARVLTRIFGAVDLETRELDIGNKWPDRRRILYEVVGRGKDMSLVVKKDEQRGFALRCNIARPNGRGYWGRRNNETE